MLRYFFIAVLTILHQGRVAR